MWNRWLLVWLVSPVMSSAAVAVEAYSLFWHVRDLEIRSTR
jgi:hypothetical protein